MKNFRSSKNLKPVDPQIKEQAHLRMKVKILQQQNALLQKSNLNIFIPITQHHAHQTIDYQAIINKLKQQILTLQQENQNQKTQIKKIQKEKQQMKKKLLEQIVVLNQKNKALENMNQQISLQLEQMTIKFQQKCKECEDLDKSLIQKNVELKFVHQDLTQEKRKKIFVQNQLKDLKLKISQVIYSSRIYKSQQIKCICLQKQEYDNLKNKIEELEAKLRAMLEANRRQKITLGVKKSDIGEQIVRLKKNIDLQLGIQGNSKHSEQFLKIYKGTNQLFSQLLKKCQT